MSIFQKRISAPNQLATLRELEGRVACGRQVCRAFFACKACWGLPAAVSHLHAHLKVSGGCSGQRQGFSHAPAARASLNQSVLVCIRRRVLFVKQSLAIISGLNADAPLGTKLSFVTGGTGCAACHFGCAPALVPRLALLRSTCTQPV